MRYHVYVIMRAKDPQLSVVRVVYCVPLSGFGLSLYSLHVLNRDINMISTKQNRYTFRTPGKDVHVIMKHVYLKVYGIHITERYVLCIYPVL